jgi:hypothetical protein
MRLQRRLPVMATALSLATACAAQDRPVTVGVLLDGRAVFTDDETSWLDGGLGKTRYGGSNGERQTLFRLSQASLLLTGHAWQTLSAEVQINVDAEPRHPTRLRRVGLIEAYAAYRPELTAMVKLRLRAGVFFPPVSLENSGPAWTTPYTITPSAVNSWIGEEVRATGAEAALVLGRDRDTLSVLGAGFKANDPAGTLLAWRGWAIQDRQTAYGDRLPLPRIPSLEPGGLFAAHAPYVEPLREIDGRVGWYAGIQARRSGLVEVRGLYWDNRGQQTVFDGFQHAWNTQFTNLGVRLQLPRAVELLAQHLWGATHVADYEKGGVDAPFAATYGLASVRVGPHRLSARYDHFKTDDHDPFRVQDPNDERGHAWTAAYSLSTNPHYRIALEGLRVTSDRSVRSTIGLPAHATDLQVQASVRLTY